QTRHLNFVLSTFKRPSIIRCIIVTIRRAPFRYSHSRHNVHLVKTVGDVILSYYRIIVVVLPYCYTSGASLVTYMDHSFHQSLTPGKLSCKGSQQLKANTPAKGLSNVKALYNAKPPPCEKPPIMTRLLGMPDLISSSIRLCTAKKTKFKLINFSKNENISPLLVALFIPSLSSGALRLRPLISNQDGICMPIFNVTGMVGERICWKTGAHPCPVSPKPCIKITVAVWRAVAAITTGETHDDAILFSVDFCFVKQDDDDGDLIIFDPNCCSSVG
uniref:Uncharacterized protein n=1 Tax=Romanomermis culicivorax TaxID=13658 RepID=A0A915HMM7_ROMCU